MNKNWTNVQKKNILLEPCYVREESQDLFILRPIPDWFVKAIHHFHANLDYIFVRSISISVKDSANIQFLFRVVLIIGAFWPKVLDIFLQQNSSFNKNQGKCLKYSRSSAAEQVASHALPVMWFVQKVLFWRDARRPAPPARLRINMKVVPETSAVWSNERLICESSSELGKNRSVLWPTQLSLLTQNLEFRKT